MANLGQLRKDYMLAADRFERSLAERFPRQSRAHWCRALSAINGGIGRRNDDESQDVALAADATLKELHDEYIRLLHIFYTARDGAGGFLGSREAHS